MWEVKCGKVEDDEGCEPQRGSIIQPRATPWEKQPKEKQPQRGCLTGNSRSC
jgi:hypothetical protein